MPFSLKGSITGRGQTYLPGFSYLIGSRQELSVLRKSIFSLPIRPPQPYSLFFPPCSCLSPFSTPLSPFPHIKQQPGSPRRISQQHSIYVSPHKNGSGLSPRTALLYKFSGSPSKVRCVQTASERPCAHLCSAGFPVRFSSNCEKVGFQVTLPLKTGVYFVNRQPFMFLS